MSTQFNLDFDQNYLNVATNDITSNDVVYLKGEVFYCQRSWGNLHYSITKFYENKGYGKCIYTLAGTEVSMDRGFDQLLSDKIIRFNVLSSLDIELVFLENVITNSSTTLVVSTLNLSKAAQGYSDLICTDSYGNSYSALIHTFFQP